MNFGCIPSRWRVAKTSPCGKAGTYILFILSVLFSISAAAVSPPGTIVQNTAASSQQVGAVLQTTNSNSVAAIVGGPVTLTKSFAAASIIAGSSTALNFLITNALGNPVQSGVSFTDTLPVGLRLTLGATASVTGGGCAATVSLVQPNVINVSAGSMTAGTVSCAITINSITNNIATNADCSTNPAAFTNGPAAISGLANVSNGVTNQCLVVNAVPTLTVTPLCFRDAGYIDYSAALLAPMGPVTITWQKLTGENVKVVGGQPLTGRLAWPGTEFDAGGNPVAWPGWALIEGEWLPTNDGLVPTLRAVFQAGAVTQSVVVTYPGATASCIPGPRNVGSIPDMGIMKSLSAYQGTSPSGAYTVTLRYGNAGADNAVKRDVQIVDALPAGMQFIPRTLKLSGLGTTSVVSLAGNAGNFMFGGNSGSYQIAANTVTVNFSTLGQNDTGLITFDVNIDPGLAVDTLIKNTAQYKYTRSTGYTILPRNSNTTTFTVTGTDGVTLRGMTLPAVEPGGTATFDNLLTNTSKRADTFNISLSGSNYPAGTVFKIYKADGVTPLADTNSDGIPDTGVVAAGGTYKIVVKAQLPNGSSGGPYSVLKNAQSTQNPLVKASDADIVSSISNLCRVVLEPNNSGRVAPGATIVYSHVLTNIGNCNETITFPANFLNNLAPGWTAQVFMDNPVSGGQSIVGVLDGGDTVVDAATSFALPPGARVVFLVRVSAPASATNGSSNTTTIRATSSNSGAVTATDITTVVVGGTSTITDEITGFIDPGFLRPTVWGFIGKPLYLRANAPSCNADPTIIEKRLIVITGPNGEREELIATETGPDTGMFVAEIINIRLPPVVANDKLLEGRPYDSYLVDLVGCGKKIQTTVTLIDPNGVVFDSRTNQPISGAVVRLVNASAGVCTNTPATVNELVAGKLVAAPNTVVTGSDGRFAFPLVSPADYCVLVTPPNGYTWTSNVPVSLLPAGRNIVATGPVSGGSYGGAFRPGPDTGPVIVDIPVDGGLIGGLFIQKSALRAVVEIGEFLDYSVTLKNNTGYALTQSDVLMVDTLPMGFTYAAGTARKNGVAIPDPQGGAGPRLQFNLGRLARDQQLTVTYRVRIGPGAMQGDGINRVVASYRINGNTIYSESNVATAKVNIVGGAFSDRAYIIGKVFADCNGDGVQTGEAKSDIREVGVPGIRLFLEDGTNVITDSEGKYSFYGLLPRTHVLKIDRTSLPATVSAQDFAILSNRNLGNGDSRIVDLKNGEMHKANFAISRCAPEIVGEINARRQTAMSLKDELDGRLQQRLETDPNLRAGTDLKALPATGVVGNAAPTANIAAPAALGSAVADTPPASGTRSTVESPRFDSLAGKMASPTVGSLPGRAAREPEILLENILPDHDNTLGFIGLKNGDLIAYAQTTIRVKGTAGARFALSINGTEIGNDRVGKKAIFAEKQLEAWEFIGVNLRVGENKLALKQFDQFGNARGDVAIVVIAPGTLAKLVIEFPQNEKGGAIADGKTPARVILRLTDERNIPITSRTAVTLSTSIGKLNVEDLNANEPGTQTFIEGGRGEFSITPPVDPAEALIRVSSGDIKAEAKLDFMPDLRDLIAAGVIEGVLNLRKLDARGLSPARTQDGFEQEIVHLSRTMGGDNREASARAAMFIKGKVKGEYLLTLAYDSDKNTRERLFRDIQPDEFYPVYGDSSVRAFDAQSTGRFYVRIDNKKSYLLYGDFNTSHASEARKLSNYSRSLTGVKNHFENSRVSANLFASRDSTRQIIDEFPANGTSGPFKLSRAGGLVNSEKIEILTRDRNQPAIVIRTLPLLRFSDYELEPLTGRILLKAPAPSLDENLNPISIRITYEVDQGGQEFWVAGVEVQAKISDSLEVGAMVVEDRNPADKFRMLGVNAIAKLADKTFFVAEIAQTRREKFVEALTLGEKHGNAERVEFRHADTNLEANIYAGRADKNFDNQSSSLTNGRQEMGARLSYKLDEKTRIKGELLHTEDIVGGSKRDGMLLVAERTLENGLRVEAGIRHAKESQPQQSASGVAVPSELTAVRARVTGDIPGVKDAAAYAELEVDTHDAARKIAAVGADYRLNSTGRIYARHEFISSLTGPYGLNSQQRQNSTVVGVSAEYIKGGNLFSEYRVRDAISGGDAEAALGLRNLWTLSEGLALSTGFERIHALSGKGDSESTAGTFGLEYTANPLWKASTRLELRTGKTADSVLSTIAGATKFSRDWTLLGRNTYSLIKNKGTSIGENEQDRMQLGVAYRDTDTDVWNALGRLEHRNEKDSTQPGIELKRTVEMISIHANWQPRRPFTFSGRIASKWTNERTNGVATKNNATLLSSRAIWEIAPRWDVSLNTSTLLGKGAQSKYYGLGVELGFMMMENLWLSAGYNFFGYADKDLTSGDYTSKGAFVRMRYKFDEDLFASRTNKDEIDKSAKP